MSDEEFDAADAGSDMSKPVSVGSLYKGSYVLIKGFPCRINDYSTAKTGKHGSAKAMYTGIDIFSGRKYEDSKPTSATAQEPIVVRKEYSLVDINEDDENDAGFVASLMDEAGETRDDLRIPSRSDEYKALREEFKKDLGSKAVYVTVLSAMGTDKILPDVIVK